MKNKRVDLAVSEVIGNILLLSIVVVVFSQLTIFISSSPCEAPKPFVTITGKVEGTNISLTHSGGESLSLSTVISICIYNSKNSTIIGNYLDNISKNDGLWNIGEKLNIPDQLLQNQYVVIIIKDIESNSVVFKGIFHKE